MPDHNLVTITTGSTLQNTTCPTQVSEPSIQQSGLLSSFCNSLRTGITVRSSQLRKKKQMRICRLHTSEQDAAHRARRRAPARLPEGSCHAPTSAHLSTFVAGSA